MAKSGPVSLHCALELLILLARAGDRRFEAAARRWLVRLGQERRAAEEPHTLTELQIASVAVARPRRRAHLPPLRGRPPRPGQVGRGGRREPARARRLTPAHRRVRCSPLPELPAIGTALGAASTSKSGSGTGVGGASPRAIAIALRAASSAIAARVSTVAEPRCGTRTTFSSSSRPGWTSRLVLEDVEAGGGDHAVAQRLGQRRFVDHRAAGGVDEGRGRLHQAELTGADQVAGLRRQRRVQADHVGGGEQLVEVEAGRLQLGGVRGLAAAEA